MIIRKAILEDAKWILEIRNNEKIRELSLKDTGIIQFENHIKWFSQKIKNNMDLFYVIESDNIIQWYCRLDYMEEKRYIISIAIQPSTLSKWLGSILLWEVLKKLNNWDLIIAEILKNNFISQNFFKNFWFIERKKWIYELLINYA